MDFSIADFLIGSIFGLVGIVYFRIGKYDSNFTFVITGIILIAYPWFVNNTLFLILIGIIVTLFPYLIRKL